MRSVVALWVCLLAALIGSAGPVRAEFQLNLKSSQPLVEAVRLNDYDKVADLLVTGQSPNAADVNGRTALGVAAATGRGDIVTLLLDHGAKMAPDRVGDTPLFAACQAGHEDAASILIARGADVNGAVRQGTTPLMAAAASGRRLLVQTLLKAGADPARTDYAGRTARDYAQSSAVASLLDKSAAQR